MTTGVRITILLAALLAAAQPSAAQRVTAAIEGLVRDETGRALPGATVTALNRATGLQRQAVSDDEGRFVLASLPVEGDYDVRAALPGFAAAVRTGVVLRADQTLVVEFTLRVAAQDTVVVASAEPTLDRSNATVYQTVNEDLVRSLPVFDRGFMSLASLAAGFTGHPQFPSPQGQLFWTNNVLVDGGSHFSKWRSAVRSFSSGYPLEAVKQVHVLTNLFSAEFGETLASVTSVATKAGTNEWHGSALVFARHHVLDATPAFAARRPPSQGQQYAVSVGGPLAQNRTHVFGSYDRRRARDRNIVASPAALNADVPDNQDEHLLFARIDHQSSGRILMARYNGQLFRWHHEPGGIALPGVGTRYATTVHTVLVSDALQISPTMLNELRAQFARYTDDRRDLRPSVFVSRAGYSLEGGDLGPLGFGVDPEDTGEVADTLSLWRGSHGLRVGAGSRYVRVHNTALPNGWGAYYFAGPASTAPFLFVQSLSPAADASVADPRSLSAFGFIQDDWNAGARVRLNLGVRYDLERVFNVRGFRVPPDANNVQPRIGLAWQPDEAGRTVVRAGVGLYTQQHLLYPVTRAELEGPDGVRTLTLAAGSPLMPRFPDVFRALPTGPLPPRDVHLIDPALHNPYSVQAGAGVQRAVLGGIAAVDYVYLNGRDLLSLVDANAPAALAKPAQRTVDRADATRPLPPTPDGYRRIIRLGNEGRSWYRALQTKFDRRGGPLHVLGSYTWSRAQDLANYEVPEDSRNLAAEKGRADADIGHNVSTGIFWEPGATRPLTRGWSVAALVRYRSNRPYTISWGDDRTGTTQNDARPGGRNTGRTGPYRTVDVSLARRFRRGTVTVDARVDVFNAFNAGNYDQYVGQLASPLFGRPVSAFPPRQVELAATVRF